MKILILALMLTLASQSFGYAKSNRKAARLAARNQHRAMLDAARDQKLAAQTDKAIASMLKLAAHELKQAGHADDANMILAEYNGLFKNFLANHTTNDEMNYIGEFAPLNEALARWFEKIESVLGPDFMSVLHLDDLQSLNYDLAVTFPWNRCKYKKSDFIDHYAGDGKRKGTLPVVTYWLTTIACSAGTFGTLYGIVCSPIASVFEYITEKKIAPGLGSKIYDRQCAS